MPPAPPNPNPGSGFSLRFHGNGINDIDRVKILIHNTPPTSDLPANVGATDFTLEFWMRALAVENPAGVVQCGNNHLWINGNIVFDRDRFNQGRKFGLSIAGGVFVWGVTGTGSDELTICGTTNVLGGQWHHVAVQHALNGQMRLFVDGRLDAQGVGAVGDVSYPTDGMPGPFCGPNGLGLDGLPCTNDVFLVIGAEKHDADRTQFPSFSGWVTEMRLSNILRYPDAGFSRPTQRFSPDASTVALYHFGEGSGDFIGDASGFPGGPSNGMRNFGGTPAGPEWVADTPFP